jgi:hypothetical protein
MALVEQLEEAGDSKQAEAVVGQLDQSFKTYHNFFK